MRIPSLLLVLAILVSGCAYDHTCGPTCCTICCELQTEPTPSLQRQGLTIDEWVARGEDRGNWNRQEVAMNLAAFGPQVICHAERWMASHDPGTRYFGAKVVYLLGSSAFSTIPSLRRLCHDSYPRVRSIACRAIGAINPSYARLAVDDVGRVLADEVWECRYHAAEALGHMAAHARKWLPKLQKRSHKDLDIRVRRACRSARTKVSVAASRQAR